MATKDSLQPIELEHYLNIVKDKYKNEFAATVKERLRDSGLPVKDQLENYEKSAAEYTDISRKMQEESAFRQRAQKKEILRKIRDLTSQIENEESNLVQLEAENEKITTQLKELPTELQEENEKLTFMQHSTKSNDLDFYARGIKMFQDRLGLIIEKTKDKTMKFIFSKVDPNDRAREFFVAIGIDSKTKQYYVSDSVPSVNGLDILLDELNQSGSLRFFVKGIRILFKSSVQD